MYRKYIYRHISTVNEKEVMDLKGPVHGRVWRERSKGKVGSYITLSFFFNLKEGVYVPKG